MPLLERIKFCAIWESNLDEFFMVRVANLHDQLEAGVDARGADGMSAERADRRDPRAGARPARAADAMLRARASPGARRARDPDRLARARRTPKSARSSTRVFQRAVFPALTPLVIGLGRPFPYISNLSLSLAVLLRDPEQGTEVLARVKVPKELLGRFLPIGESGATLVPLEDLIAANLSSLFPGMEIVDHCFFRVTRDTDYDVSDEADDLLQAVEEELRRRRFGEVVRLEVDRG